MNLLMRHGRKALELHKWCGLRFSIKLEQNASALSNSASATSHLSPHATSYVSSHHEDFIISNLIDLYFWIKKTSEWISNLEDEDEEEEEEANSESYSVLNLFRSHCRISRNITCHSRLLRSDDSEKALVPKLEFLQFRGASSSISFYNDYVRNNLRDEEADNITRDVFFLKVLGVPQELLIPLLNFKTLESANGKEKYKKAIKDVVDKGFDPTTLKIFQALRVFYVLGQNNKKSMSIQRSSMFKKFPHSLTNLEKKITQT